MPYVKKLEIKGFKSFANRTVLPFDKGINAIIGPNGSGKSNISDALCFVLGRLSSKSLRAAKASNLIFQGSKTKKPAHEASVELVFDNSDKAFLHDAPEVSLKRIVRRTGSSIYKINNETKTRQEVLELLGQAGIDPNGFNLILQGEISRFVKMRSEDRREIIEEIAGISIYESRKRKSLKEIEKTEQKLKEVSAVLRERTSYLKNLEEERKQALKFKELEVTVKKCKSSIIKKKINEKTKSLDNVTKEIEKKQKFKQRIKDEISKINAEMMAVEERINEINKHIKKSTGLERETLNEEVTMLNSKIAADSARKENFEKKLVDNELRKAELNSNLQLLDEELSELKDASPRVSKQQEEIKNKKQKLEEIEEKKEKLYSLQTEITNISERIRDKQNFKERNKVDSNALFNQINTLSEELSVQEITECEKEISNLQLELKEKNLEKNNKEKEKINFEKEISILESEIQRNETLKAKIPDSDICPLCQNDLTKKHIDHVLTGSNEKITSSKDKMAEIEKTVLDINKILEFSNKEIEQVNTLISNRENDLIKLRNIEEKKIQMKRFMEIENEAREQIETLRKEEKKLKQNLTDKELIEEKYNKLFFELQELSSRTDENLNTTILYKEREIESITNILRNIDKDNKQIEQDVLNLDTELTSNTSNLNKKQKSLDELNETFKKLFDERSTIQERIKEKNILLVEKQNIVNRFDEAINNHKVEIAKVSAEKESLDFEVQEFGDLEILPGSVEVLTEKLNKSEQTLSVLGSVNLRALETYDAIKEEYHKVYEKVEKLELERDGILKIIDEIDRKKKRTFMKTFNAINDLFTSNFSQLSVKGKAYLEIENKEDIFAGGVSITIKVGKGKYFDVTSLSGGEQTLIALSLIFSIQEFKPYAFYIFDEIDAALDKRNSELLGNLLKKYIKTGQYIIISHNDSIISSSDILYGVSMNDGISKVLSLDIKEPEMEVKGPGS